MTFGLEIEEYLKDYLRCHIKMDEDNGIAWIQPPHVINNLKSKFGEEAMTVQPWFHVVRPLGMRTKFKWQVHVHTGPALECVSTS
jgi:hypothetical protein